MKSNYAYCIDMGGTFLKGAIVDNHGNLITNIYQVIANSSSNLDDYLNSFSEMFNNLDLEASKKNIDIDFIALSVPGPFDYEKGISKMVHKYQAIYDLELKELFLKKLNINKKIHFENDVISFLLGESINLKNIQNKSICAITLGTGLGYVVMKNNTILRNELGSPKEYIYDKPFKDGKMEDYFSARGLIHFYNLHAHKEISSAKEVSELAKNKNLEAIEALNDFGKELGKGLLPYLSKNNVSDLYLGGQVSKAFPYFSESLKKELKNINVYLSKNENSALIGLAIRFFHK